MRHLCPATWIMPLFLAVSITPIPAQVAFGPPAVWPVSAGGNGNSYQVFVAAGGISWSAASAYASSLGGYLATITSATENTFVASLITAPALWSSCLPAPGVFGPWIGGVLGPGGWGRVTGEPFSYANWDPGEPNNGCPGQPEERIHFANDACQIGGATWNDYPDAGCAILAIPVSFVVELPCGAAAGPVVGATTCGYQINGPVPAGGQPNTGSLLTLSAFGQGLGPIEYWVPGGATVALTRSSPSARVCHRHRPRSATPRFRSNSASSGSRTSPTA